MKTKKTPRLLQTIETEPTSTSQEFDPRELALRLLSYEAGWKLLYGGDHESRPRERLVMLPRVYEVVIVPGPECDQ